MSESESRETTAGSAAAMREALRYIVNLIDKNPDRLSAGQLLCIIGDKAEAAISAPARNCDVGTAREQSERMEKAVCSKHHGCLRCPLRKAKYSDCSLVWAQMPYTAQEGGAK